MKYINIKLSHNERLDNIISITRTYEGIR